MARKARKPSVARSDARTRETRPSVADRTAHCLQLIVSGEWVHGSTTAELAAKWSLDDSTVRRHHSEALRLLRRDIGWDAETARAELASTCDRLVRAAMSMRGITHIYNPDSKKVERFDWPAPDIKGAAIALKLRAQALGLLVQHSKIELERAERSLASKSPEELAAEAESIARLLREQGEDSAGAMH